MDKKEIMIELEEAEKVQKIDNFNDLPDTQSLSKVVGSWVTLVCC